MKKFVFNLLPLMLAIFLGCNRPNKTELPKQEDVIPIHKNKVAHLKTHSRHFAHANEPKDVEVVKDMTPMGFCTAGDNIEYVVGDNYLGRRRIDGIDTIREGYLVQPFPPKVVDAIFERGKNIIPYLIQCIDIDDETGLCGYHNPYYSTLPTIINAPVGINYAYMIELIMSKDTIEHVNKEIISDGTWNEVMSPYLLYRHCIIVKKDIYDKTIMEELTIDDMKKIKNIYMDWWEKNKNLGFQEMRKEWRKKHIFRGQPYMWV